ncbi:hypothetical protein IFM89_036608 [Coptis chinensis]|uniref:Uncharacterized protein n=1 Tax=Coptis chinensis TaxID=261450 RepID=A0A835HHF8_9MAGN|nr:hypothetical protein IFM89_036608 [Coptis chinensis]
MEAVGVLVFTAADMIVEENPMNAKRGGNGVSKNKIGSRGTDKVVLVSVGTMIHLVEGELPSIVDSRPVKALDPWGLPDTLEDNQSNSDHSASTSMPSETETFERKNFDELSWVEKSSRMHNKKLPDTSATFSGRLSYSFIAQSKGDNAEVDSYSIDGESGNENI